MDSTLSRRSFLALAGAAAILPLAACGRAGQAGSPAASTGSAAGSAPATSLKGAKLTFVGDDAFAPYRSREVASDGSSKVVGLDIDVADELARRLGFTYDFEPQDFAATLASIQGSDTSFTLAMSANEERKRTYDFTRGYYQPLVGVLTAGGDPVTSIEALGKLSIACTTGTVQNKFVTSVLPNAEVHTYDGGDQCLQEALAGRVDAYVCDGAEGQSMQEANPSTVLGLLPRETTADHVGVYRVMAKKGASFVAAFDGAIAEMLEDGTLDGFIAKWVGEDFTWGDGALDAAGESTVA